MTAKYKISLSAPEKDYLQSLLKNKGAAQHKKQHAQILIAADEGGPKLSEEAIAKVCGISTRTVQRTRKRCVEEGLEIAVESKFSHHGRTKALDGEQHAQLIALVCSDCPEGRSRWTLNLLADKLVELKITDKVSASTICRELKKTN